MNNQSNENKNCTNIRKGVSKEEIELFKCAIEEGYYTKIRKLEEEINDIELSPPSRRHKRAMNRLFREHFGSSFIPFPEEDTP